MPMSSFKPLVLGRHLALGPPMRSTPSTSASRFGVHKENKMANGDDTPGPTGWMNDVQRAVALILVGTFASCAIIATIRLVIMGDPDAIIDMVKTLQAALVNMALIALGFFFGSNMSKVLADAGQQKIVEKLTSTQPPGT